jgi:hypothetical protein
MNGEKGNPYRLLMVKPEGERPVEIPRCRWVDYIKMDLGEIAFRGADWICLAQDRDKWRALVNVVMNLQFHKMLGGSKVAAKQVASRVIFLSIELISQQLLIGVVG